MLRNIFLFLQLFLIISFYSCNEAPPAKQTPLFDYVLPQAGYVLKINKPAGLKKSNPLVVDLYLNNTDKKFLSKTGYTFPFIINILQSNNKIKGFVSVGQPVNIDSLFNGKITTYDGFKIYSENYRKQSYYAVEIDGMCFISNQKLLLENCIRDRDAFGRLTQNDRFLKGINSLDANAEMNIVVITPKLKNDILFRSPLKIKWQDLDTWQFLDITEINKQIASGIGISQDTVNILSSVFKDIQPVTEHISHLIPFAIDYNIILTFDDFESFVEHLSAYKAYAPETPKVKQVLKDLQAIAYFSENQNKAVALQLKSPESLTGEASELIKEMGNYSIYKFNYPDLINTYFGQLFPRFKAGYYTVIDDIILVAEHQSYLEKILNDIHNKAVLTQSKAYQKLKAEIPDAYHLSVFANAVPINRQKYLKVRTFKAGDNIVYTNLILKGLSSDNSQGLVQQVLMYPLNNMPVAKPQLGYNHKTKQYNIIYQDDDNTLTLIDLNGKKLWQTPIKDKITGDIKQVDILRNRKLQYTFVTPHHWYVIDRLGRNVEGFPQHFMQKITRGISVFDYEKNRKYRFGITQSKKFRLFDNKAKKVKGFKVKTGEDIVAPPQHFRIGNKDFIQMQDAKGKLYLLNRRGVERVKVSQTFKTTRNNWGVYHNKFVNVDDNDRLVAIDLSGKIKSGSLDIGQNILSEVKYNTLAAVAGQKLLINKKLIELDLGNYSRPKIFKAGNKILIFIANTDDNRIYAYDSKANLLPNFPIIGNEILDFKAGKNGRYLLVYDSTHNLIVYKF